MTVRGPVAPDELGVTLMHEHLFNDIRGLFAPGPDSTATFSAPGMRPTTTC